jgi:hypothetical protein
MVSIPKIIGVISCGVVLSMSLASATQAFGPNPCANRKGGLPNLLLCSEEKQQGIQTIKGEVLRVDGDTLLIERFNGKAVRLQLDPTVKNGSVIKPGDRIEAKVAVVNYEERVLSIREIN